MLWPVRIHAQPPWRGEHPLRGLYSPMDPRSNCASGSAAGHVGSNMQGIGLPYGVFYPLAARQDPSLVSVRQTRLEGTFPVSDATYCEGLRICNGAPDEAGQKAVYGANSKYGQRVATAKSCCYGGLRHSIKLYSPRMPTDWNCRGQTDPAIQAAVKANRPIKIV